MADGKAQILGEVATILAEFEARFTAKLSNMQEDLDERLAHLGREASSTKPVVSDVRCAALDSIEEDLNQLKDELDEARSLLSNEKEKDFSEATGTISMVLHRLREHADGAQPVITSRQRLEATLIAEVALMKLSIGEIQESFKDKDSQMQDVSNNLQQVLDRQQNLNEEFLNLERSLDMKVDRIAWKEANDDFDMAIKTVREMVSRLRLDVDTRRCKVGENMAITRQNIIAAESSREESKANPMGDTDQVSAQPVADNLIANFRGLDVEGSGTISLNLLRQLAPMPREMEDIINSRFADKHGFIYYEQFVSWLSGHRASIF
eukprot:CAMPEP_0115505062 /NCGR_PEP_ID=MMETSP0271-20121206/70355_1 /TAXON_ID=71861 /ORGANISM="Scrippsiella trochoidea, Strain CCMP3099" /LENGTH=321 /DNA_ID=CAMNT_0002934287 /DNA_START=23 /DNA_END=988 /DNA_ORIENTATION=+